MSAPFTIIADADDRGNWLEARKGGIGASEIAAVLNCSPFTSAYELACVKIGLVEPPDLDEVEAVFWGTALEDAIIAGYHLRTKRPVVRFGLTLRSVEFPWLTATPDALTTEGDGEKARYIAALIKEARGLLKALSKALGPGEASHLHASLSTVSWGIVEACEGWFPLQIKNIGFGSAEHWLDGVPDYYTAQCRQEALAFGAPRCTAAALIAGQRLAWDDVWRDEVSDMQITNLSRRFWEMVQRGEVPEPDGSAATKRAIAGRWPIELGQSVAQLDASFLDPVAELQDLKAQASQVKARTNEIENLLRDAIGASAMGVLPDGTAFTLKSATRQSYTVQATTYRTLRRVGAKKGSE